MSTEPLRAALYIRVSSEEQAALSPDAQRRAMMEYAKREGMEVMLEYIFEDHITAKRADNRDSFMKMIGLAKTKPKPFDVIIVHKLDRFARNKEESVAFKAMLRKKCDIKVMSATEPLGSDKNSILLESLLEGMAEYFLINLSEEVKKGMTEKALRGEPQGFAPLGYKMKPKDNPEDKKTELEVVESEAIFIRYIFSMFVDGKDISTIARTLNNKYHARTKKGNKIGKDQINYILRNPVYAGKLRWTPSGRIERGRAKEDSIIAVAKHEAIVSEEMFQKAQDKLAARELTYAFKGRPYSEYRHWLSSLMKCSNCGATLMYKPSESPAFQCKGYTDAKCDISHYISVRKAEKAILGELRAAFDPSTVTDFKFNMKRECAIDTSADELAAKENQLVKIGERLERARTLYIEGIDTLDEYKTTRQELEDKQARLTREIDALKTAPSPTEPEVMDSKFKDKVKGVVEILTSDYDLNTKITAIKSIIVKIVYDKPNKTLEVYYRSL